MLKHALRSFCARFSAALLAVGFILVFGDATRASEIVLKVDSLPSSRNSFDMARATEFTAGSRFFNVFEAPVDGRLVGVQVLWGSQDGGAAPSVEAAIRVSTETALFELPLITQATVNSPVLEDGVINEFRFLDPGSNLIPLSVDLLAGTRFYVDLELANAFEDRPNQPAILIDGDGQLGENYAVVGESGAFIPFGINLVGGADLGIRAIFAPIPEPSTYVLFCLGIVGFIASRGRRRKA